MKLHRKIKDSAVGSDDWLCRLWIQLMVRANWRSSYFRGRQIDVGQIAFSYRNLADALGVSTGKLRRGLDRLVGLEQITVNPAQSFSVITLCNYRTYQLDDEAERNTDEHTDGHTDRYTDEHTDRHVPKKGKKGRKKEVSAAIPPLLESSMVFLELWGKWLEHRKQIRKTLSVATQERQLKKLSDMGLSRAVSALEHSLDQGYQGIFEPNGTLVRPVEDEASPAIRTTNERVLQQREGRSK